MRLIPRKRTLILTLLISGILLCGIVVAAGLLLPWFLQHHVLPGLAESAGIENFSCGIRGIGFFGADLADIRLGTLSKPGIVIDSLRIDYSPKGIFHKTVREIRLNGLSISGEYTSGVFSIPGLLPLNNRKTDSGTGKPTPAGTGNFIVQKIVLSNGNFAIATADGAYRVPFHIEVTPTTDSGMDRFLCRARAYPFGQRVELDAGIDLAAGTVEFQLASSSFRFDSLAPVSDRVEGLTLSGSSDINVLAGMRLSPFAVTSFSAKAEIHDPDISYGEIRTAPFQGEKEPRAVPIKLSIDRQAEQAWNINLSDLRFSSPIPFQVRSFSGKLGLAENTINVSGDIMALLEPFSFGNSSVAVTSPLNIACDTIFKSMGNESWTLTVNTNIIPDKTSDVTGGTLRLDDFIIKYGQPSFQVFVKNETGGIDTDFGFSVDDLSSDSGALSGKIDKMSTRGTFVLNPEGTSALDLTWESQNTRIHMEDTEIHLPRLSVKGRVKDLGTKDMGLSATVAVSRALAAFPGLPLNIKDISARIPVSWPRQADKKPGDFSVGQIRFGEMDLGPVSGELRQEGMALDIRGTHQSHVIPDFGLIFSGKTEFTDPGKGVVVHMDYESLPYETPFPLDLERFASSAGGFTIDGDFGLSGNLSYTGREFNASLATTIRDAALEYPEAGLAVKNIQAKLLFPDLFSLKSAPKQSIEFGSATMGGLSIEEGLIEYQMESMDSFLIEKAGFKWCNGHVDTHALRIRAGKNDYNLVLYCDRLNLAMLLEQFGAADADGKGTVNGRIPLKYADGSLIFQDGFLYSTPGQGGRIRVRDTEKLLAGIPSGTAEYMQMDLAREVLKSYDYNWATLGLATEGNDLMMRLSFDGKPTDPLPFVYEKDLGGFAKLEVGKQGSVFQGVNMDINFRLPLDALLQYREIFNMIQ
jgi:hypothetical protein